MEQNITENEKEIIDLTNNFLSIDTELKTISKVVPSWKINETKAYISPSYSNKIVGNKNDFYSFHFDEVENSNVSKSAIIKKSGNLFCYGWITAPKVIDPTDAWVGIEGRSNDGNWILISLQPWIIGEKSNVMQYIGFNCPVQEGQEIRIRTGFTITDFSRSFSGKGLVINIDSQNPMTNINNTFIGYVFG